VHGRVFVAGAIQQGSWTMGPPVTTRSTPPANAVAASGADRPQAPGAATTSAVESIAAHRAPALAAREWKSKKR